MEAPLTVEQVCQRIGKTPADLAELLEVTTVAISQWSNEGFPPHRALELERRFPDEIKARDLKVREPSKRGPTKKAAA